jgi:hypothetical protein
MEDLKAEALSLEEQKRIGAAIQISDAQAKAKDSQPLFSPNVRTASPEEELAELKAERDRPRAIAVEGDADFNERRDCDRILAAGTVAVIGNVEVRLLRPVPAMAEAFRDEAIFAESLAHAGAGLGPNTPYLRNRYNGSGAKVGVNEDHPLNKLDARIAELELEVDARAKAKAAAEEEAKAAAAPPIATEPVVEPVDVRASAPSDESKQG